jgi:hypothetical protein
MDLGGRSEARHTHRDKDNGTKNLRDPSWHRLLSFGYNHAKAGASRARWIAEIEGRIVKNARFQAPRAATQKASRPMPIAQNGWPRQP